MANNVVQTGVDGYYCSNFIQIISNFAVVELIPRNHRPGNGASISQSNGYKAGVTINLTSIRVGLKALFVCVIWLLSDTIMLDGPSVCGM